VSGRAWRDDKPKQCGLCGRQWPTERLELVERLIGAERRARVAEQALRDRMNEPDDRCLALAQQARIDELTGIVERLNQTIARKKAS
jgi:transcriptional regulator GlxA family with amidase domain